MPAAESSDALSESQLSEEATVGSRFREQGGPLTLRCTALEGVFAVLARLEGPLAAKVPAR